MRQEELYMELERLDLQIGGVAGECWEVDKVSMVERANDKRVFTS